MSLIPPEEESRIRSLSVEAFAKEISDGRHKAVTSEYRAEAEALLRSMQANANAAAAAEAERIARTARNMAILANVIAIIAIAIAIKSQIRSLIAWATGG